ncbi:MAG: histone H1 [Phycisphaeraceae bacterium]|nr:histone H1 [Phycisphaeraceae bacterium]
MRTLLRAAFKTGVEAATKQARSNMAREGGLKGGKARAKKLAPEERRAIARKAANKRWGD